MPKAVLDSSMEFADELWGWVRLDQLLPAE
jgi:hypothetical protein